MIELSFKKVSILGVEFIDTTLKQMIERLARHVKEGKKAFVVTANPEIALLAYNDAQYKRYIEKANYVTADGIGVVKAAGLLGHPLPERVTGFEMFVGLLEIANQAGMSVYLLGAQPEVLTKASEKINSQFPNVRIVGSHHGFFDWNDAEIPNQIHETKPDFVFVALGVPRQEKWIAEHLDQFEKGVFMGIGGSFDVLAGTVKRAPAIWQKLNVEWLYRLVKQPSRWRRMLALPIFAGKVIKQKVKGTA